MKPVVFAKAAEFDVIDAARRYRRIRPALGDLFTAELKSLCDRISATPEMYQLFNADCRRGLLYRFHYAVATPLHAATTPTATSRTPIPAPRVARITPAPAPLAARTLPSFGPTANAAPYLPLRSPGDSLHDTIIKLKMWLAGRLQ